MKKVLIYSFAYYPHVGGAEVAIKEITDRLTDYQFDLITYNFGNEKKEERVGNINIYRITAPTKFLFPKLSFLKGIILHRKNSYDVVWAMMANTGFAALALKLFFPGIKFVLTIQEGDPVSRIKRRVWFVYPIFQMVFKRADIVTALSNYLADFARSMGAKKAEVVPNGVDLNRFAIKGSAGTIGDKNKIVLISTSRLVKKNAIGDIIRSLKFLPENVVFRSIGLGMEEVALKNLVDELGLEDRVEMLPFAYHDQMVNQLSASDIFIRPSLSEGLGISFLEAMAVGLPIIATNVGGIPDFLTDGKTGLFCEVNNPKSIADKVMRLIKEPDLYKSLSRNGRTLVEQKYNWDMIASKFNQLFI
ncbi:MAG: glycosyltransferase family 4 protein [Candidatus Vogelbacteria bacterium]|nr:glycosyltransferase family 4 protein [Candidatus Vogelbacteria bacterium]